MVLGGGIFLKTNEVSRKGLFVFFLQLTDTIYKQINNVLQT